jgi:hypothetical protein
MCDVIRHSGYVGVSNATEMLIAPTCVGRSFLMVVHYCLYFVGRIANAESFLLVSLEHWVYYILSIYATKLAMLILQINNPPPYLELPL